MHYQELQPSGGNVDDENVYEGQQQNPLMNVEEVRQLQAMAEENSGDESGEDYQQESDRESRRSRASSRSVSMTLKIDANYPYFSSHVRLFLCQNENDCEKLWAE